MITQNYFYSKADIYCENELGCVKNSILFSPNSDSVDPVKKELA
jgi:hypothetical protein